MKIKNNLLKKKYNNLPEVKQETSFACYGTSACKI